MNRWRLLVERVVWRYRLWRLCNEANAASCRHDGTAPMCSGCWLAAGIFP